MNSSSVVVNSTYYSSGLATLSCNSLRSTIFENIVGSYEQRLKEYGPLKKGELFIDADKGVLYVGTEKYTLSVAMNKLIPNNCQI